ncbi:putative O-methyltransferase [Candidatus Fokinia solitaria]|uniref:Putative O-methyltransferase n=1 Tax=Candidatus Fokinia solitaria TaxID=1802984 RepID=A0A2U8BT26_9RICK|nr:class I SAM-dependent methyltransferase [Candidatus Fokinia solitaria]AWD33483.1 putative O-methyltransferase [Candidatus Fokinia solitaria]
MSKIRSSSSSQYEYISKFIQNVSEDHFEEIRNSAPTELQHMQITAVEGSILRWLIATQQPTFALEIGTFVGYSTAWLAAGMQHGSTLISVEKSHERLAIAKNNLEKYNFKCEVKLYLNDGKSKEERDINLQKLLAEFGVNFGFVFCDGAKSEYMHCFQTTSKYLKKGGLFVADNVTSFHSNTSNVGNAIDAFNSHVCTNDAFDTTIIPTCDGLMIARKK